METGLMLVDMMIVGFLSFGLVQRILGEGRFARRMASVAFIGGAIIYGLLLKDVTWEVVSFTNGLIWFGPVILVVLLLVGRNFRSGSS
ncbi:MAG: hypothetical protein ACOX2P_03535 [Bacillota bacterium]